MADVFSYIPAEYVRSDAFWIGRLSTAIGIAAADLKQKNPREAEQQLRGTLAEFLTSPVPSEELRSGLRRYL